MDKMQENDPRLLNTNTPSHEGIGKGNEAHIFKTEVTEPRRELVERITQEITPENASVSTIKGLMDYDICRPDAQDLQGTYLIGFRGKPYHNYDKIVLRLRKFTGEPLIRLSDDIFRFAALKILEKDQYEALTFTMDMILENRNHVLEIDGYHANFTYYQEGRHIISPTQADIETLARGVALLRNAYDKLPEEFLPRIEKNHRLFNQRTQNGLDFIKNESQLARQLAVECHGPEKSTLLLELLEQFSANNNGEVVPCHGWLNEGNILIKPNGGLHVVDNENTAATLAPRTYDAGVALYRAILQKMPNPTPGTDRWAIETFLKAYNQYAEIPMRPEELIANLNTGGLKAATFAFSFYQEGDQDYGLSSIKRHGGFALDNHLRIQAATHAMPTPPGTNEAPRGVEL